MQAYGQPRHIYEELIELGADVKAVDAEGYTVLHHFFERCSCYRWPPYFPWPPPVDIFLEGGEIVASLIKAGADPLGFDGKLPSGILYQNTFDYLGSIRDWINVAIWHQALRLCLLPRSKYCNCSKHYRKKKRCIDSRLDCTPCMGRHDRSMGCCTFEKEMSAALLRWDKDNAAQELQRTDVRERLLKLLPRWSFWEALLDKWDKLIQEVLTELHARRERISSDIERHSAPSVIDRSKGTEQNISDADETQSFNPIHNTWSSSAILESNPDEDWETSDSSSSDDEWQSAPET